MDDRKGKETKYHHAEELDLGGGFSRATDTRMYERGEPESSADRAWRGRQRISQHMTLKPAPEVTKAENKEGNMTEAQKRAQKKYDEAHRKDFRIVNLKLNREADADIIEKLEASGNIQGYIKSLIRADI